MTEGFDLPGRAEYETAIMQIVRKVSHVPAEARGAVLALGNFDGVHRGHQAVIGAAGRIAAAEGAPHGVLTLDPHPRRHFRPEDPAFELTPRSGKERHMRALGVQVLFMLPFDHAFSLLTAEDFVAVVLITGAGARHVVVGYDFVFGHKRTGDVALLRRLAEVAGIGLTVVEPVIGAGGEAFSSTSIRRYLSEGAPDQAAELLGRCWEIEGEVEIGDRRGREIGFPTANVHPGEYMQPALGVYAVWAGMAKGQETEWHAAVANIGRRPTFDGEGITVEVHILDFSGDLYGQVLRVALVEHLRPERKFDGLPAIKEQIGRDCDRARALLAAIPQGDLRGPPRETVAAG